MATELNIGFGVDGRLERALDLSTIIDPLSWPSTWEPLTYAFESGTGDGQIDAWWHDERTLAATTNDDLDIRGGTASAFGDLVLSFAKVKLVVININTPTSAKYLRVGPQGVANAFQGWHGGVAAGNYDEFYHSFVMFSPYAGWPVTAGTGDILRIYNPTASSITYQILLAGVKP